MKKVWLITGCSTGFGRALAQRVLQHGGIAGVCARNTADVNDLVAPFPETALALQLDVTKPEEIQNAVKQLLEKFGRIDVLVNNAGIGYFGAIEESEEAEVRRMLEINFFWLAAMTNAVLPQMRKQRSGHIINISSIGGLMAFPGIGFYNATKFAVDGLSESLAKEVAHLGIKVTIVAPSGFRTDWAGRSANESPVHIEDYAESAGANRKNIRCYHGKQPGDPARAAAAIMQITTVENPPLRLLLGNAAVNNAQKKLEQLQADITAWEAVSRGADGE